ncbi:MAG: hypothetical protein ACRC1J_11050 [Sandaracinobacteroides sp.]
MEQDPALADPTEVAIRARHLAAALAESPALLERLTCAVHDRLAARARIETREPVAHVTAHFQAIAPEILADTALMSAAQDAADAFNANAQAGVTESVPGILIGGIGLAVGGVIIAIIAYCLSDPHIEPGTSAPAHC